jgi:hypothetical protein
MKGFLLAVLGREEYPERIATELHNDAIREEVGAATQSSVRITDLRLATTLEPQDPTSLEKELLPLLQMLERPITPDEIRQWKWDLLWKTEQMRGRSSEETEASIVRVSFAAAALLLSLDLGMPGLADASEGRLAKQISELADIIRKLSKSLNSNANKLEKLLAYRAQNRPSTPGREFYEALVAYRMGEEIESVAEDLGLTPYKSSPSEPGGEDFGGTKHWKNNLEEKLKRGAEIEQEKYPLATTIFRNRHKSRVQTKARLAYRSYLIGREITPEEEDQSPWFKAGGTIHVSASTDSGLEVIQAYVQLGSCLERELKPFPTRSDFNS